MNKSRELAAVLTAEATRQGRSLRSVGIAIGAKNLGYKLARGSDIHVSTLLAVAGQLGVPAHELLYRAERSTE